VANAKVTQIDRGTRLRRRIDGSVWTERRTIYINGTRKGALAFIAEWLDGATLTQLAHRYNISVDQLEDVVRWWQRGQIRSLKDKSIKLRAQLRLVSGEEE
jgi:hypothetical protein